MKYMKMIRRYCMLILGAGLALNDPAEAEESLDVIQKLYESAIFAHEVRALAFKYHHRGVDPDGPMIFHNDTTHNLERLQEKADDLTAELLDSFAGTGFDVAKLEASVSGASISQCAVIVFAADFLFPAESKKIRQIVTEELSGRGVEAAIELARIRVWLVLDKRKPDFRRSTFIDAFGVLVSNNDE